MILLVNLCDMLRRKEIELPPFDANSEVREHHDKIDWESHASSLIREFDLAASMLHITDINVLKEQIDNEMENNDKFNAQSFSDSRHVLEIKKLFASKGGYVYAYLSSIDKSKSEGKIKFYLIYHARKNEEGK